MKKLCLALMLGASVALSGCGTTLVKADIVCDASDVIKTISSEEDAVCNKMYAGKIMQVAGKLISKGTAPDDSMVITLGTLRGNHHDWFVKAYIKDSDDKNKLKKMSANSPITVQGCVDKAGLTIPKNNDRVIELLQARIVEK